MNVNRSLSDLISRALGRPQHSIAAESAAEFARSLDEYVTSMPSTQNMVDVIQGWNHALPPQAGATAGVSVLYNDPRIHWAVEQLGSIKNCSVLELGPLEASHTYMLEQYEPATIDAIEANRLAYFRCLIAKEILGLKRAHFHLGNFISWLEQIEKRYDLIVGSGVLYHMEAPVHFLELLAQRSDAIYLWTHYFSDEAMPAGDPRRTAFLEKCHVVQCRGVNMRLHQRSYYDAWKNKNFCGGPSDNHYWLEKPDLLRLLEALGFNDIRTTHDQPDHPNGPAFSVFASRTATVVTETK